MWCAGARGTRSSKKRRWRASTRRSMRARIQAQAQSSPPNSGWRGKNSCDFFCDHLLVSGRVNPPPPPAAPPAPPAPAPPVAPMPVAELLRAIRGNVKEEPEDFDTSTLLAEEESDPSPPRLPHCGQSASHCCCRGMPKEDSDSDQYVRPRVGGRRSQRLSRH